MSQLRTVTVIAPSRLHFGLLSFGQSQVRQYGGVGVMLEEPAVRVVVSAAERLDVVGTLPERVAQVVARWGEAHPTTPPERCRVELVSAPRLHTGLGVGTQVALAVGAALNTFFGIDGEPIAALARKLGRGVRSAVGTYGFAQGGLIAELGKLPHEALAPLHQRVALPAPWRFVLVCLQQALEGLSGCVEQRAFYRLPPVPPAVTRRLQAELCERLLPAARDACFEDFSESLYAYGQLAGWCFEAVQGGAYHGPQLHQLVERIRALGIVGVGQSSWGPTIFALCPDAVAAHALQEQLVRHGYTRRHEISLAPPNNSGARIESGISSSSPCSR